MQILEKQSGTWKWGLLYLILLAPFFFITYGFANQYAANLAEVAYIVFDWEKYIPLWPWTIVPYWSIDLFYGLSLLICWNKFELKQHALRLFSAQIISISCFLIFPLKFTFERPELTGFFGLWFDVLMGFDKPFNQAPSLHIVLLVILWDFFRRHVHGHWKYGVDFWAFLIGVSVLTTWQHHFIDIPTGILVGAFCIWLFPLDVRSPFKKQIGLMLIPKHLKMCVFYLIGSILFAFIAFIFKGIFLWLLYPAISLLMVSLAYLCVRPHFFQKKKNGQLTAAAYILFAPYLCAAWLNSRLWTHRHPQDSFIIKIENCEIHLGRIPQQKNLMHYQGVFDCCSELPIAYTTHNTKNYDQYLSLDLIPIQADQLDIAVNQFDQLFKHTQQRNDQNDSRILIFCALGYSRSTSILCAWLIKHHYANNAEQAIEIVQKGRPWIVLNKVQIQQLNLFKLKLNGLAP